MKIAVVTPVYQTPRPWLEQCLAGVRSQTAPCTHFLVIDGDPSLKGVDFPGVELIGLPRPHEDNGNAARAIGSVSAIARGFDGIAYLDADNWFEADHLQKMLELHERTGAAVCTAGRNLVDLEGRLLGRCPETDGEKFADTSTLFFTRAAFGLVAAWYRMPRSLTSICDRVIWQTVKDENYSRAHGQEPTVNFRTNYRAHYVYFGKTPPAGAKHIDVTLTSSGQFGSAQTAAPSPPPPLAPVQGRGDADGPHLKRVQRTGESTKPASPARRERVSLCMIVKNEEERLGDCLQSVADLFDEIIVVDTGSTDRTKEVACRYGATVHDFAWVDSFAAARNESLRHAGGEWIFWLDGDERFDAPNLQKLRGLLDNLPQANSAYLMCQWSAPDQLTGSTLIVDQTRLFRKLPGVCWRYRVHEQILMSLKEHGAQELRTDIAIAHSGYQDPDARRRKRERNVRLLCMELADNPHEAFAHFNLANAYVEDGRVEDAAGLLRQCLEHAPARASYLPKTYYLLAGCCQVLGRDEEALHYCREGKQQFPEAPSLWFQEGMLLLARGDLGGARHAFERILKLPPQGNYSGVDARLTGCRTRHNLGFIYRRLGLVKEAEEQWRLAIGQTPDFEPPWLALVELYLEQDRHMEAEALLLRLEGKPYRAAIYPALEARLTLGRGQIAGARRVLEAALEKNPRALWLRIFLSDILFKLTTDKAATEKHLRAILALAPNEIQAQQKLAQLLARSPR